jgi:hypothetical protein
MDDLGLSVVTIEDYLVNSSDEVKNAWKKVREKLVEKNYFTESIYNDWLFEK